MECLKGLYRIKNEVALHVWIVEVDSQEYIAKLVRLSKDPTEIFRFFRELEIGSLMSEQNIGVELYEYCMCNDQDVPIELDEEAEYGILIMEKLDGDLSQLWPFIGEETREMLGEQITDLVTRMHNLGVIHGDLHSSNIGYKEDENGGLKIRPLDFGESYYLSWGKQEYLHLTKRDWDEKMQSEQFDWKKDLEEIPLPSNDAFKGVIPPNLIDAYLEGDCGTLALALHERLKWPIYAIASLREDGSLEIPSHYVLSAPGRELFLDITGLRSLSYLEEYWSSYFEEVGFSNLVAIYPTTEVSCNSHSYQNSRRINETQINQIADQITQIIRTNYV